MAMLVQQEVIEKQGEGNPDLRSRTGNQDSDNLLSDGKGQLGRAPEVLQDGHCLLHGCKAAALEKGIAYLRAPAFP